MKNLLTTLMTLTSLSTAAAFADSLKPMHAASFDLGDRVAVVYYTEQDGDYEVVTTVGPSAEQGHQIVRHVASLTSGDDYRLTIAGADRSHSLEIKHAGNELLVTGYSSDGLLVGN